MKRFGKLSLGHHTTAVASKRRRLPTENEEEDSFTLQVHGRENYEILSRIRDSLELAALIPQNQIDSYKQQQAELYKQACMQGSGTPTNNAGYSSVATGPLPSLSSFRQPTMGNVYGRDYQMTSASLSLPPVTSCLMSTPSNHHSSDNQVTSSNTPSTPDESPESSLLSLSSHLQQQSDQVYNQQTTTDFPVASWLDSIELSIYTDVFNELGYYNMSQLIGYSLQDLQKMKIKTQHRNKIWRSLVEYQSCGLNGTSQLVEPSLTCSTSAAALVSNASHTPVMQGLGQSGSIPPYYEVTKYTFKHTISLKKDDHDYC